MGEGMSFDFSELLSKRKLMKIRTDEKLTLKEIEATKSDLEDSKESLGRGKLKWATIQGYYSMFHSARALVYNKGYGKKAITRCWWR